MLTSIVIADAAAAELEPAPITADWILAGTPRARNKTLATSDNRLSWIVVWECTAGRFNWQFSDDETAVVISGAVFVTTPDGKETRLGVGDVGYFPAGSSCVCRIEDHVKKIAILQKEIPSVLSVAVRAWHKFLRMTGQRTQESLASSLSR